MTRLLNHVRRISAPTLAVCVLALGAGCSSPPTWFYVLSSVSDTEPDAAVARAAEPLAIGIGPVELPDYLDRPQIVTRSGANQLRVEEFHQWAEPLRAGFVRALAENVSRIASTERVFIFPWDRSTRIDFQVVVQVMRFETVVGGASSLVARWSVRGGDPRRDLVTRTSRVGRPGGESIADGVTALSQTVEDLGREIAATTATLAEHREAPDS